MFLIINKFTYILADLKNTKIQKNFDIAKKKSSQKLPKVTQKRPFHPSSPHCSSIVLLWLIEKR